MSTKPFTIKFWVVAALIALFYQQNTLAQPIIKLNDVLKFELVVRGGGLSGDFRRLAVVQVKGSWTCYQTRLIRTTMTGLINDSARTLIKNIPIALLEHLLTIIAKHDTSVNIDLFKIDRTVLARNIDSVVDVPPSPAQRAEFINAITVDSILKKALYEVVHPRPMDDRTYYGITITTRNGLSYTISALSFAALYYLPWHIDTIKSYDPDISRIFAFIAGNQRFEAQQKEWLYKNLARNIYWKYFTTRFNLEHLKSAYPDSYAILKETFKPSLFTISDGYTNIYTPSTRLPNYVNLRLNFKLNDTTTLKRYKRYEDTLVAIFKKRNFLFDYLRTRPESKITLIPGKMGDYGKYYFRDIKKYFSGIDNYDFKTSQLIEISGAADLKSRWILFPDNTLLLMEFGGVKLANDGVKFMNIPSAVLSGLRHYDTNGVCIVFDASGKVLHNYGTAEMPFY